MKARRNWNRKELLFVLCSKIAISSIRGLLFEIIASPIKVTAVYYLFASAITAFDWQKNVNFSYTNQFEILDIRGDSLIYNIVSARDEKWARTLIGKCVDRFPTHSFEITAMWRMGEISAAMSTFIIVGRLLTSCRILFQIDWTCLQQLERRMFFSVLVHWKNEWGMARGMELTSCLSILFFSSSSPFFFQSKHPLQTLQRQRQTSRHFLDEN